MASNSRLIVNNLPKKITEEKLRELFSSRGGTVTDVQLKYTPEGKFRHFCFIGYKTEEEAEAAKEYFDKNYIGGTKISVQSCVPLGDPSKPRAWSKYAADSTSYKEKNKRSKTTSEEIVANEEDNQAEPKPKKKKKKEEEILEKCIEDPDFREFLESHRKKSTWGNDTIIEELEKQTWAGKLEDEKSVGKKPAEEEKELETTEDTETKPSKSKKKKTKDKDEKLEEKPKVLPATEYFTIKLRDIPKKAKKKDIKTFFHPLTPKSIRFPPKFRGVAWVGFLTDAERKSALRKNKSILLGNKIMIRSFESTKPYQEAVKEKKSRWADQQAKLEGETEPVGESGRIFIRNLSYLTNEDEIRDLFVKYGPVTEVHLPLDRITRRIKGIGFVSFLLPEHATKAFSELDGTIFQGRMLHLLPSKGKDDVVASTPSANASTSSFKKSKAEKEKKVAGSSHNWNTLFLGQNAVAEAVSKKYGVSREDFLLDKDKSDEGRRGKKSGSIGIRMALAEAEIVDETRTFLEANDVSLAAFENKATERSKTCLLIKNLQAHTTNQELLDLFSPHGEIERLVLPPSGITGIISFMEPAEARAAFKKLAYTNFKGMPLYLEWAPKDTFSKGAKGPVIPKSKPKESSKAPLMSEVTSNQEKETTNGDQSTEEKLPETEEEKEPIDFDGVPEPDTTLFVKNLNFNTKEQSLRKHFEEVGKVYSANIATKRDSSKPGQTLSMGYGFVQYYRSKDASQALKTLQQTMLNNHLLELKKSNRTLQTASVPTTKNYGRVEEEFASSKIIVRNVPFQATREELMELFATFGGLIGCRLPLKIDGSGSHRGFAFVEFQSKTEAMRAFDTLGKSTHLYGRRLVLEWASRAETVEELRSKTAKKFSLQSAGGREASKVSTKKAITRYFNSTEANKKGEDDED